VTAYIVKNSGGYSHDRSGTASWDATPYLVGYATRSHMHRIHMHS
jgi:hypothetical protein